MYLSDGWRKDFSINVREKNNMYVGSLLMLFIINFSSKNKIGI